MNRMHSRTIRLFAVVVTVVLVATGCFRVRVDIEVNEDGSGRVSVLSAIDTSAAEGFAGSFDDAGDVGVTDPCAETLEDARNSVTSDDVTVEPYEDGKFCGAEITVEFGPGDDVTQSINDALAALDGDDSGLGLDPAGGDLSIRRDGEGWLFESINANTESDDEDLGDDFGSFAGQLLDDAELSIRVKLPGRQVEHNADRIESDGTMVWEIDPLGDDRDRYFVRTEPGETITGSSGGSSTTWLIVGAVVIAAALLGFFVWRQTRRPSSDPQAPGGVSAGTPDPFGASPSAPAAAPSAEPVWDATLGAYVMHHPTHGRLVHDQASGEWRPVPSDR